MNSMRLALLLSTTVAIFSFFDRLQHVASLPVNPRPSSPVAGLDNTNERNYNNPPQDGDIMSRRTNVPTTLIPAFSNQALPTNPRIDPRLLPKQAPSPSALPNQNAPHLNPASSRDSVPAASSKKLQHLDTNHQQISTSISNHNHDGQGGHDKSFQDSDRLEEGSGIGLPVANKSQHPKLDDTDDSDDDAEDDDDYDDRDVVEQGSGQDHFSTTTKKPDVAASLGSIAKKPNPTDFYNPFRSPATSTSPDSQKTGATKSETASNIPPTTNPFPTTRPVSAVTVVSVTPELAAKVPISARNKTETSYDYEEENEDDELDDTSIFEDNGDGELNKSPTTSVFNPKLPSSPSTVTETQPVFVKPGSNATIQSYGKESTHTGHDTGDEDEEDEEDEDEEEEDRDLGSEDYTHDASDFSSDKSYNSQHVMNSTTILTNQNSQPKPLTGLPLPVSPLNGNLMHTVQPPATPRPSQRDRILTNSLPVPMITVVPDQIKSVPIITTTNSVPTSQRSPSPITNPTTISTWPTPLPPPSERPLTPHDLATPYAPVYYQTTTLVAVSTPRPDGRHIHPVVPDIYSYGQNLNYTDDSLTRQIYDKAIAMYLEVVKTANATIETVWPPNITLDSSILEPLITQPIFFMFALGGAIITLVLLMMLVVYMITHQIEPKDDNVSIY